MATIDSKISRLLNTLTSCREYIGYENLGFSIRNIRCFSKIIKLQREGNKIEIPTFLKSYTESYLHAEDSEFLIPFGAISNRPEEIKTPIVAISKLLERTLSLGYPPYTIKCDGNVYYGSTGFILDENFNILLMPVLVREDLDNTCTYRNIKLYIHPKVFVENNKVYRLITTKLIPRILSEGVFISSSYSGLVSSSSVCNYIIPEISILDVTDKFISTATPLRDVDTNLNDVLKDNINDIYSILCP